MEKKPLLLSEVLLYVFKSILDNSRLFMMTFLCYSVLGFGFLSLFVIPFAIIASKNTNFTLDTSILSNILEKNFINIFKDISIIQAYFSILFFVISLLVFSLFYFGFVALFLEFYDTGSSSVFKIVSRWYQVLKSTVMLLLYSMITIIGLIFFIVPGILFFVRFSLAPWYIVDQNMGIIRAFGASFSSTRGQTWNLLMLYLIIGSTAGLTSFIPIGSIGWLLMGLASTYIYRQLVPANINPIH